MHRSSKLGAVIAAVASMMLAFAIPALATTWANDDGVVSHYKGGTPLWTKPIPASAPVSSDNAYFVSWEKAHEGANYWKVNDATTAYAEPFAVGHCTDPVYKFTSTANLDSSQKFLATVGFHAPDAVFQKMVSNNDQPFVVMDVCGNSARPSGFSVWGANVQYNGTRTLVSATGTGGNIEGGSFAYDTNGLDSRSPLYVGPANENFVSRGRPPDTMFIRDYLLQHPAADGTLGYSPEIFFVETNSAAGNQPPMVGNENNKTGCGGSAHPTICAEGQFVRINPNKVFPSTCTGPALVLAKTLQIHGGFLGDNSGSGTKIKAENGTTVAKKDMLAPCMSLSDLQILAKGYHP